MRRRALLLVIFGMVFAAAAPAAAQDPFAAIRENIRKRLVEEPIPSLAVAVARDGKILWEEGFGWADRESRVPATEHTMYSLASITKPITATGLMVLAERKLIELDKPVNDYLGAAKLRARVGDAAEATVRRVAGHTSGLGLHYQFFYEDEPYARPSMDETILRYGQLFTAPGERYQYSNLGYGILDYLLERVSGRSYADFMRAEVFLPLGLTRTSVGIGAGLEKFAAARYNREGLRLPFYDFDHRGGSAVFASAHDLVRFGMFHLKSRLPEQRAILSDAAIDEMQKPGMGNYGLGWSVNPDWNGRRVVSHTGGMPGVSTVLWIVPGEKIAIVVLANTQGAPVSAIAAQILAAMLNVRPPEAPRPPEEPRDNQPLAGLAGEWRGALETYQGSRPLVLRIEESGTVRVRLANQLWTLLNQVSFRDGWLSGRFAGDVGAEDASRRPHTILLTLKLRGEVLNGAASSVSISGPRGGNAQTHWVELRKRSGEN
jgi:CubicO group peptidase (beta-lactamase class C family)